jgi:hypothetical protein
LVSIGGVTAAAFEGVIVWQIALPFASGAIAALPLGESQAPAWLALACSRDSR